MVNAFRLMVFVIVLAVVIGSIMVTSAEDARITINSPSDGDTVNTKTITVSGTVVGDQGAVIESVTVNGDPALGTAPEGGFSSWEKKISLQEGRNKITVEATDIFGHNTTKNRSVFYITPPSAPQNLQLTAGDDYVNLGWIAPHDDGGSKITKYNIYRGTAPGGERLLRTVDNVLIYEDHDVTNDQKYYYQVSAVNSVGEGEKSMEAFASTPTPTATPISTPISTPTPTATPISTPIPTATPTHTNLPPVCSFRCSTKSPEVKERVEFDASDSCDHDGKIKAYLWDFGDGKDEGIVVSHAYSTGGTCTVKLRVIDDGGAEGSTETIIVINHPPKSSYKFSTGTLEINKLIEFDASSSEDLDGYIKEYRWDFGDGETGREKIVYHNYSQTGTYTVMLTVTDNKGAKCLYNLTVPVEPPRRNWGKIEVFVAIIAIIIATIIAIIFSRRSKLD